jgi:exonuclease SbcC
MEIDPGTSTILGIMGSGKSSILQAIVFALYGDLPSLREKRAKLDNMIMSKPIRKNSAEIEVTFGAKGEWWTVKRKIERGVGTTHSEIRKNDMLIESGAARVTDYITNLLGVNFDLFTKAVYAKQNEIDYFLTLPKGKRMEKMDELLNLDKLEDSRHLLSSAVTKLRGSIEALEGMLKHRDPDSMKKELSELTSSILTIEENLNLKKKELNDQREKLSQLQVNLKNLEEKKNKLDQLEKQYFSLEQKQKDLREKLELLQMFSNLKLMNNYQRFHH